MVPRTRTGPAARLAALSSVQTGPCADLAARSTPSSSSSPSCSSQGSASPHRGSAPSRAPTASAAPAAASATPAVTPAPSPSPLVGTTYVLAPDGHDDDPGSAAKPWATLAHAAKRLKPGDTLEVKGGTYRRESIDWQTSGSADGPITIRAAAGEQPVFDGGGVGHFAVIRGGAAYLVFDGLTITGYDIVDDGIIVAMDGAHHLTFQNLRMTGNDGQDQRSHLIYLRLAGRPRRRHPGQPARRHQGRGDPPVPRAERPARAGSRTTSCATITGA